MRKVCIIVNSRANYARIYSVLRAIQNHKYLKLQLVVGASALLYRFGKVIDRIDDADIPLVKLASSTTRIDGFMCACTANASRITIPLE